MIKEKFLQVLGNENNVSLIHASEIIKYFFYYKQKASKIYNYYNIGQNDKGAE